MIEAWDDAVQRGPGWRSRLGAGLRALEHHWPLDQLGWTRGKSGPAGASLKPA